MLGVLLWPQPAAPHCCHSEPSLLFIEARHCCLPVGWCAGANEFYSRTDTLDEIALTPCEICHRRSCHQSMEIQDYDD